MTEMDALQRELAVLGFQAAGVTLEGSRDIAEAVARATAAAADDQQVSTILLAAAVRIQASLHGLESVPGWLRLSIEAVEEGMAAPADGSTALSH